MNCEDWIGGLSLHFMQSVKIFLKEMFVPFEINIALRVKKRPIQMICPNCRYSAVEKLTASKLNKHKTFNDTKFCFDCFESPV